MQRLSFNKVTHLFRRRWISLAASFCGAAVALLLLLPTGVLGGPPTGQLD